MTLTDKDLNLNFHATFSDYISPFTIYLDDHDPTDGAPVNQARTLAEPWATEYNWPKVEADLNSRFQHFTTVVHTNTPDYPHATPLHFIHHRSALPPRLARLVPRSSAHHYALARPPKPGLAYRQLAGAFHALMLKLGYTKYVFQGSDCGDFINWWAAADYPENVVAGLSNFWLHARNKAGGSSSADEQVVIAHYHAFVRGGGWSYGQVQQTRPLRLAFGLGDSPVGLTIWIYESLRNNVADVGIWTPGIIITWTMMHWEGTLALDGLGLNLPYVHQPVAISGFPHDLWYRTPLDWVQRSGNIKQYTVHQRGGHFAGFVVPDLLVQDMWRFFGDRELSGTGDICHDAMDK
ncbi:Alpha/Beta hydrolase protein [Aspergillus stella-maris]|uniref:Alpha/Beta hydrolase protein n=1 Tax=Aspergillus stella-maris TaxID=1810926 RepID=UPI003CCDBA8E